MAFLDNSGDIILDAVLTDSGRQRLSRGDGSFKIVKFALADDEINYGSYNKGHASGSAYYDLEILQTPIIEALTNNTSVMKSKLISIPRTNLLYLPIMKINANHQSAQHSSGPYVIAVDDDTENSLSDANSSNGIIFGANPAAFDAGITIDQGLHTGDISAKFDLDADLVERQYIIEMDNRLGQLTNLAGAPQAVSYIDDDQIASYFVSLGVNTDLVLDTWPEKKKIIGGTGDQKAKNEVITGPRGTRLQFKIKASIELNTSTFLFEQIGLTNTVTVSPSSDAMNAIDSTIRITGATTGYRIDLPVRFIKKV